jgi:hypothetical protein
MDFFPLIRKIAIVLSFLAAVWSAGLHLLGILISLLMAIPFIRHQLIFPISENWPGSEPLLILLLVTPFLILILIIPFHILSWIIRLRNFGFFNHSYLRKSYMLVPYRIWIVYGASCIWLFFLAYLMSGEIRISEEWRSVFFYLFMTAGMTIACLSSYFHWVYVFPFIYDKNQEVKLP